jgi:hypothetical protein
MGKPSKQLMEFMAAHKIDADEVWEVRAGGAWAIKHSALERVAAEKKIVFHEPRTFGTADLEMKIIGILVTATMGDRTDWSTGEAAPYNNKNGYPLAMAEKRARDRVTLKLLNAHGTLYSEEEAEDFKRQNPHVTRPTDIVPDVEYDQYGQPVDNIPDGEDGIERLPKAKARADYEACQKEMRATKTLRDLEAWATKNANRIASYPSDWAAIMRGMYAEHRDELREKQKEPA